MLSPATVCAGFYSTYCRPSSHTVTGDDISRNSYVCLRGGGGGGGEEMIIIINVFVKRKILSIETILSKQASKRT